jgi:hypothetical protein
LTTVKKQAKKLLHPSWPKITDDLLAELSQDPDFREPALEDPLAFKALLIWAIGREKRRITKQVQFLATQRGTVIDHDLWVAITRAFVKKICQIRIKQEAKRLQQLLDDISEQVIILFIGAGISFDSDFGWKTICAALAYSLNKPREAVRTELEKDFCKPFQDLKIQRKTSLFKKTLRNYVLQQRLAKPNSAHSLIAELLAQDRVEQIVCFNWDNFIEEAYAKRTGKRVDVIHKGESRSSTPGFWKPHGCVTRLDIDWVLPCEPIQIPTQFLDSVADPMARCVLCLGFKGGASFTKDELELWFGIGTPVYDIRPGIDERKALGLSIAHSGKFVLERIVKELGK